MKKRKMATGLIKLTRYQEYLLFVTITTTLGFIFSDAPGTIRSIGLLAIVLLANMLSVAFSFMINDVEDAPDDALSPQKTLRNPISAGLLSRNTGLWASLGVAGLATIAFYPLGMISFLLGLLTVVLGFLYSWKTIRLKRIPVLDLISHGLMLSGLQFLTSYFTFTTNLSLDARLLLPLILVTAVSMYGELYNEVRDFTYDKLAGITHTAALIGKARTHIVMYIFLASVGVALLTIIYLQMIPIWFMITFLIIGGLFFANFVIAIVTNQQTYATDDTHRYILLTTAVSLVIWTTVKILKL